ncbi:hypothetical protein QOZ80_8BG0643220 [Eleusine coracana subsp. coracana]|nr:hypothetical protein QOZ80_8BG0643220 [Eleusine coracana subsp. coracana]
MSLRRFLYMVADDWVDRSYSLRRIDTSRFFFFRHGSTEGEQPAPTPLDSSGGAGAIDPSAMEVSGGRLPESALSVVAPHLKQFRGAIDFMLFKKLGNDGENYKVVSMDHAGSTLMCDPGVTPAITPLPSLATPKFAPFSLTVGSTLYVMDAVPERPNGHKRRSFEALFHGHLNSLQYKAWHWQSDLEPPPYVYGPRDSSHIIESYAVVAGSDILMSNKGGHTYLLRHGGRDMENANLCSPPVVYGHWKEYTQPPADWRLVRSCAVHLGGSKFCIVRFFETGKVLETVVTGVEVESSDEEDEEVRVLRHKWERYQLNIEYDYWVL